MDQWSHRDGRSVLPAWWVTDTTTAGDSEAWRRGNFAHYLPGGRYRNQWYQAGNDLDAYLCIGIHGQFLYVAPRADVVIAMFASFTEALDDDYELMAMAGFDAIARALAG